RESQTGDGSGVAAAHLPECEIAGIAQLDQAIASAACQRAAIRAERQCGRLAAVRLESMRYLSLVRIDNDDLAFSFCLIPSYEGSCQPLAVWRPCQVHAALMGLSGPATNFHSVCIQEHQTTRLRS